MPTSADVCLFCPFSFFFFNHSSGRCQSTTSGLLPQLPPLPSPALAPFLRLSPVPSPHLTSPHLTRPFFLSEPNPLRTSVAPEGRQKQDLRVRASAFPPAPPPLSLSPPPPPHSPSAFHLAASSAAPVSGIFFVVVCIRRKKGGLEDVGRRLVCWKEGKGGGVRASLVL